MDMSDYKIFANKFGLYAAPPEFVDRPLIQNFFAKGIVYELRTIEFICNMLGKGDVVSAGAWIGDFFPAISRALSGGALLHSAEPQPRSNAASNMTIALNHLTNVRLHNAALGHQASKAELRVFDTDSGVSKAAMAHIERNARRGDKGTVSVDVVRLDSLIPEDRHVSVIHFDLEGFEPEALQGASAVIERCKPTLVIEGRKVTEAWLNKTFSGCAYREVGFFDENTFYISMA